MIKENHPGEEDNVGNTPHFFSMLKNSVEQFNVKNYFDVSSECIIIFMSVIILVVIQNIFTYL